VVDVKLQDAGPATVYSQQYRLLRLAGVTFPSPRQQCVIDLQSAVAKSVANQEAIIIVGDFNEQLGRLPNLMASVFAKNDLFDVHARFHGIAADIPTYARGTTRLDYCGASVRLTDFIHSSGFSLFNEHFHSDHRASFVDIRLKSFFGHDTPTALAQPEHRFVTSSSANVSKFVQKMYSHLHGHKAFHQYQNFCLDADVVDAPGRQANKIDQVLGQAFQTAERHCSKTPCPPWSVKLHLASLKVRSWQTALTERRTGVTQSTVLHNLAAEIWCDDSPPSTPRSTKILKHVGAAAPKALRRIRRNAAAEREAFLLELKTRIALRMSSKDADADAALKNIERQLSSGRRFRRITGALKSMNNAALTKVEIVTK
jgi:hypothetical protein